MMPRRICLCALLALALSLPIPLLAQQAAATANGGTVPVPLNLSLPREATAPVGGARREEPPSGDKLRTPSPAGETEAQAAPGQAGRDRDTTADRPYGTGFEARQRGYRDPGFGGSHGQGGFRGGKGMGRGR